MGVKDSKKAHQAHALCHSAHWLWQFQSLCVETQLVRRFISSTKESHFFVVFPELNLNRTGGVKNMLEDVENHIGVRPL